MTTVIPSSVIERTRSTSSATSPGQIPSKPSRFVAQAETIDHLLRTSRCMIHSPGSGENGNADRLEDGQLRKGPGDLERARNSRHAERARRQSGHAFSFQPNFSAVGTQSAGDDAEQRRLAGAIGTDDAERSAFLDRNADVAQRAQAAKPFLDSFDLEQRRHARDRRRDQRPTMPDGTRKTMTIKMRP
jgi:hypothetical protein